MGLSKPAVRGNFALVGTDDPHGGELKGHCISCIDVSNITAANGYQTIQSMLPVDEVQLNLCFVLNVCVCVCVC